MKKRLIGLLFFLSLALQANETDQQAKTEALTLDAALSILESQNLEIKAATLDVKAQKEAQKTASGANWGKLDLIQNVARSDDAGNVFGFKLTSREANFGDFGFSDFLACQSSTPPAYCSDILHVEPKDLNYPDARNFFQTKLSYQLPIFTGFKISSYTHIMEEMTKLKTLDKEKIQKEKIFELKKSFYDMGMLEASIAHMNIILNNIKRLEKTTDEMIKEGYAKKVDLLEVQAKKANVKRILTQMQANQKLLYHYISFLLNQKVTKIITPTKPVAMPKLSDQEILNHNTDIQKALTGLEIQSAMVKVSEADLYYPMIGFQAELSTADNTFLGDANDHKAYTIGAQLRWNLFNGGIDVAKSEQARVAKLKVATQVELAKKGIALQVAKIRTEIESLDSEIASLKKELELLDTIYANYEGRYKEKLVSMNDVIIKQSQQIEKVLQLLMAQNKRTQKIFELEKLAN